MPPYIHHVVAGRHDILHKMKTNAGSNRCAVPPLLLGIRHPLTAAFRFFIFLRWIKTKRLISCKAVVLNEVAMGMNVTQASWCKTLWKHHVVFPGNWLEELPERLELIRECLCPLSNNAICLETVWALWGLRRSEQWDDRLDAECATKEEHARPETQKSSMSSVYTSEAI